MLVLADEKGLQTMLTYLDKIERVLRRALLRRKYGGDRGTRERARAWRAGAVVAAARSDDEQ